MKTPLVHGVCIEGNAILPYSRTLPIAFLTLFEVIFVKEILPRIIWWVNIDTLNFLTIPLLEYLEHFEVLTLNDNVFSLVGIDAASGVVVQGSSRRCESITLGC